MTYFVFNPTLLVIFISYEIVDPVTGQSYPVVRTGDTVIITDELKRQVWKDRGNMPDVPGSGSGVQDGSDVND